MTDIIKSQLVSLKDIVSKNIETLNDLIKQSEKIEGLIETFSGKDGAPERKEMLESIKSSMDISIKELIKQTTDIFEIYETLVHQLLSK